MELYTIDQDKVINAYFLTGRITYEYALNNLVNLIDKLDIQRKFQNETFYKRLELDFQIGCITPAITIAFIRDVNFNNPEKLEDLTILIKKEIATGFILDGIQRLNTLKRVFDSANNKLDLTRFLYVNIILCPSRDNLLYRMVTLNNGQKPMTARHQIEILAESIYNFESYNFKVYTEKQSVDNKQTGFKKSDIINAYISFLSNSTSLDNKKIIEDKLDELLARKIIESKLPDDSLNFDKVLTLIGRLHQNSFINDWLKNGNNLVGFSVGIRTSYESIANISNEDIQILLQSFEKAFKNINVSTIKLSRERRKLSSFYISKINEMREIDSDELTLILAEQL